MDTSLLPHKLLRTCALDDMETYISELKNENLIINSLISFKLKDNMHDAGATIKGGYILAPS